MSASAARLTHFAPDDANSFRRWQSLKPDQTPRCPSTTPGRMRHLRSEMAVKALSRFPQRVERPIAAVQRTDQEYACGAPPLEESFASWQQIRAPRQGARCARSRACSDARAVRERVAEHGAQRRAKPNRPDPISVAPISGSRQQKRYERERFPEGENENDRTGQALVLPDERHDCVVQIADVLSSDFRLQPTPTVRQSRPQLSYSCSWSAS